MTVEVTRSGGPLKCKACGAWHWYFTYFSDGSYVGHCEVCGAESCRAPRKERKPVLSTRAVASALRKAGFKRSEWLASGRVRGWGSNTEGFDVRADYRGYITVSHTLASMTGGSISERRQRITDLLAKYADALRAAGYDADFSTAMRDDMVIVGVKEE